MIRHVIDPSLAPTTFISFFITTLVSHMVGRILTHSSCKCCFNEGWSRLFMSDSLIVSSQHFNQVEVLTHSHSYTFIFFLIFFSAVVDLQLRLESLS